MKVLISPDSYKGSLSALEAAKAMASGFKRCNESKETILVPMADGGEGTTLALVEATGGTMHSVSVTGPLGEPIVAQWGKLGDGTTGVVEVAQASGLTLVPADKRNPLVTTSYGTGELIKAALDQGCTKLILGIGGSATNDGAMGLVAALGVKFLDGRGNELTGCGGQLHKIARIDTSGLDSRLEKVEVNVACDVTNPLCGEEGAASIYGPQKGATPEMVRELDQGLFHFAQLLKEQLQKEVAEVPGAGAAGGIGAGLLAFLDAQLTPGVDLIIDATGMEQLAEQVDLVITGEGKTDGQTARGKAPAGVAKLAKKYGKPVICISGSADLNCEELHQIGVDAIFSTVNQPMELKVAMDQGAQLVENTAYQVARLWQAGLAYKDK
ncbi:glycerate kinase [Desulfitispora alkaliphila]|uniref:glycerate kinase n=1 Tax=Desulfitispora alkaliphila TaxID=622674 RepID=UPI003D2505C9